MDAYILVKGIISIATQEGDKPSNGDEEVLLKSYASFTDCISYINNTEIDNAKEIDIVMPMCDLIEYNNSSSRKSGSLRQYCRDEPVLTGASAVANFLPLITKLCLNLNKT